MELIKQKLERKQIIALICALVYWIITFITQGIIFDLSYIPDRLFTYITLKIVTFVSLYYLFYLLFSFIEGIKTKNAAFYSVIYGLPYTVYSIFRRLKCGAYPYIGDERAIFADACAFSNVKGMFNYLTSYFHMVSLQLYPHGMSIIIFKHIIFGIAIGYCIYRLNRLFKNKWGFLLLAIFFLPYVRDISWSVHRMPMYGPLYLLYATKLYCDYKENVILDKKNLVVIALITAVLTQWRVEGIMLLLLGPIIAILAYHVVINKKNIIRIVTFFIAVQAVVYFPQYLETSVLGEDYVIWRSAHIYNYVLPNMLRNGLDREKNAEYLETVNSIVPIKDFDDLNEELGESVYYDEFVGITESGLPPGTKASIPQAIEYESTIRKIIIHNPFIFIKTQLGAFLFITKSYGLSTSRGILYTITGNLIVPAIILFAAWAVMLKKRKWFEFSVLTALLCHAGITTILLPAAYFKYYFAHYIIAYAIIILLIASAWQKKKSKI